MGGAPRPPMGGAPRPPMGGLPAAGAPRPPMMASGGIVGFQQGGLNDQQRRAKEYQESKGGYNVQAFTEALKRKGLTRQQFEALSPAEKQAIRATLPQIMQELKQTRDNYMSPLARINDATSPQALAEKRANADKQILKRNNPALFAQQYPDEVKPNTADVDTSATDTTDTSQGGDPTISNALQAALAAKKQGGGGGGDEVKLAPMQNLNNTESELKNINFNAGLRDGQKVEERVSGFFGEENEKTLSDAASQNIMGRVDDKGQFQKGLQQLEQDRLDARYNIDKRDQGLKSLGKDVSAEERRQMSPEVQRAQRLQAARGTYSQLARNRGEVMDKQNEQRLEFSKDKLQRFVDRTDKRIEALAKVDANVASTVAAALKFKSDALTSLVNLSSAKATDVQQQADSFIRQNSAEIANRLTAIGIGEEANLRITMQRIDQTQQLDKLLMGLVELRAKYESDYLKSRQLEIDRIDTSTNEGKMELSAIQTAAKTAAAAIGAPQEKIIQKRMDDLTGISFNPASLLDDPADSPETFDTELEAEADQALLNRNKQ
tara:strand:- start:2375 stop:4021 length:1647 start_codon:yes stop_codon:yes gene_type:complete